MEVSISRVPLKTTLVVVTAVLALLYLRKRKKSPRYPPGPKPWPVIGNLLLLQKFGTKNDVIGLFMSLNEMYGDIVTIYFGSYPLVILNNITLIKEAFVLNNDSTDYRPVGMSAIQKCTGGKGKFCIFYF